MLDFCAEHAIAPEVEVMAIGEINEAYKKVKDETGRFRFVIDMASLKQEMTAA